MEKFKWNEGNGGLFKNTNKKEEKYPDFTGQFTLDGKEYRMAGWATKTKKGEPYISLRIEEPYVTENKEAQDASVWPIV